MRIDIRHVYDSTANISSFEAVWKFRSLMAHDRLYGAFGFLSVSRISSERHKLGNAWA